MTCFACRESVEGTALLVPRLPKGSFRFHADRRPCVASARRRALAVWPNVSLRGAS